MTLALNQLTVHPTVPQMGARVMIEARRGIHWRPVRAATVEAAYDGEWVDGTWHHPYVVVRRKTGREYVPIQGPEDRVVRL